MGEDFAGADVVDGAVIEGREAPESEGGKGEENACAGALMVVHMRPISCWTRDGRVPWSRFVLEETPYGLSAAYAHRGHAVARAAPLHFVD